MVESFCVLKRSFIVLVKVLRSLEANIDQDLEDLQVASDASQVERTLHLRVLDADVRIIFDKQVHQFDIPLFNGVVKGSFSLLVLVINIYRCVTRILNINQLRYGLVVPLFGVSNEVLALGELLGPPRLPHHSIDRLGIKGPNR